MPPVKTKTFKMKVPRAPAENDYLVVFYEVSSEYSSALARYDTSSGGFTLSADMIHSVSTSYSGNELIFIVSYLQSIPLYAAFLPSPI